MYYALGDVDQSFVIADQASPAGHPSEVSGELVTRNEEGRRVLGKFTLSGQGPGFSVQIDSEKGASVSTDGGPFTSDFARITPPQLRNLPYLKAVADTLNVKV